METKTTLHKEVPNVSVEELPHLLRIWEVTYSIYNPEAGWPDDVLVVLIRPSRPVQEYNLK